jgi:hypothetical protein
MTQEIENIKLAIMSGVQVLCYTGMIVVIALWLLKRLFYGRQK